MEQLPIAEIREAMRRTEGTLAVVYESATLFDPTAGSGIVFETTAGSHVFRIERDADLNLTYFYTSPGTGTRSATVDLKATVPCPRVMLTFTWSPTEIGLYVGPLCPGGEPLSATGTSSPKSFRVGADGAVYQVGDVGVNVSHVSVYSAGKAILLPTAIEAWNATRLAIETLQSGKSDVGYMYEAVVCNLTITVLITGFETYTKTRFLELESEGIQPNVAAVINRFYPERERRAGLLEMLSAEATEQGVALLRHIVNRGTINFQNFQDAKVAFNKAYGVKFGDLGIGSHDLERLQRFFAYRHRITHVSAMIGMLNQANVPPEEPEFPKTALAHEGVGLMDSFIQSVHAASLILRREDK